MNKRTLIFILFALLLTSCGEKENVQRAPAGSTGETPVNPENPNPPNEKNPNNQLCYLQTSKGQTCFDFHDLDSVNRAEPKYDYMDSFNNPNFPSGLDKWQYRRPINLLFASQHLSTAPMAENFLRFEVLDSNDTRGHYGFFSPKALQRIQQMRESFGKALIINSGYRSPGYNATLPGAARFSRHTYGDAIDFKVPGVSFERIAQRCLDLGAGYYQIYATHIHCDWRTTPLNEQIYGQDLRQQKLRAAFSDVQHSMESHVIITATPLSDRKLFRQKKRSIRLSAENIHLEDGYGVQVEWSISNNDDVLKTSTSWEPIVTLFPGLYTVTLTVGGSLQKSSIISIQ